MYFCVLSFSAHGNFILLRKPLNQNANRFEVVKNANSATNSQPKVSILAPHIDPCSDMWALGVICYILLSGFSPFMGDNDAETYANISGVTFDFDCEEFDQISEDAKVTNLDSIFGTNLEMNAGFHQLAP